MPVAVPSISEITKQTLSYYRDTSTWGEVDVVKVMEVGCGCIVPASSRSQFIWTPGIVSRER
jgi:hypothetical protein